MLKNAGSRQNRIPSNAQGKAWKERKTDCGSQKKGENVWNTDPRMALVVPVLNLVQLCLPALQLSSDETPSFCDGREGKGWPLLESRQSDWEQLLEEGGGDFLQWYSSCL